MAAPRILVANRGEIAVRVLCSARELGLYTIALFTSEDDAHVSYAHEGIQLQAASSYLDVGLLVSLSQQHGVSLVHPGYGFLSESAELSEQLAAAGVTFVGPSPDILRQTGDKLRARKLAEDCGVPVLPALAEPVEDHGALRAFVEDVGLPIMIKAVDGGGGRGIRLVSRDEDLEPSFRMARNESPSRRVFAEKAAGGGFRHVEVQVLGDGRGNVRHFWERECSIQRRFQKMIEMAPSTILDRHLVSSVIDAALRMATAAQYASLGTWEFLVCPESSSFFFMEINPRLQVEHTVTEAICGVDLVRCQILLAQGGCDLDIGLNPGLGSSDAQARPPASTAVQLRITAEDTDRDFSLSIGRIRRVLFPGGPGVRVDSHLRPGVVVSTDFDSLLAKIIVVGWDWRSAVAKAVRALQDVLIDGVETNIALLQRVVQSGDFEARHCDIHWLESQLDNMSARRESHERHITPTAFQDPKSGDRAVVQPSTASDHLIRKGDRFDVHIEGGPGHSQFPAVMGGSVAVTAVMRNDFPAALCLKLSTEGSDAGGAGEGYTVRVSKLLEGQQAAQASQRRGGSSEMEACAVICPMAGQLVEILVDDGDPVSEGDAIIIIRQMKMELEVRAHRSGIVRSLFALEEGEDVAPGSIVCNIMAGERGKL